MKKGVLVGVDGTEDDGTEDGGASHQNLRIMCIESKHAA